MPEKKRLQEEGAVRYIENVDEKRKKWTKFLYDVDWTDPMLYHMVINLGQIALDTACGMILYAIEPPDFKDTPKTIKAIQNLGLSSQVKAKLALDPRTTGLELDAESEDGKVSVKGQLFATMTPLSTGTQKTKDYITEIAKGIPAVKELIVDFK